MTVLLAAVDDSPAARPVIETALRLGALLDASVEAVHVVHGSGETARRVAASLRVPLREESGEIVPSLLRAAADDDVLGLVAGSHDVPASRSVGHVSLALVAGTGKLVAVVPPEPTGWEGHRFCRALVPLDGTPAADAAVQDVVHRLQVAGSEVVVVHVFQGATAPRFLDRPAYDIPDWADEFLARHCAEPGARLTWRLGPAGAGVVDVARLERPDLIVLSWSGALSPGRAAVVQEVLHGAGVPVLLVPVGADAPLTAAVAPPRRYASGGDSWSHS